MSEPSARDSELRVSRVVSRIFTSWNQLGGWLKQIDSLRRAA